MRGFYAGLWNEQGHASLENICCWLFWITTIAHDIITQCHDMSIHETSQDIKHSDSWANGRFYTTSANRQLAVNAIILYNIEFARLHIIFFTRILLLLY
jgi:hypothetical protein